MKKLLPTLLGAGLCASLAFSTAANADDFYIGTGIYQSDMDVSSFDDDDTVPAAFVGYQFLDSNFLMLSAELGYYDLGSYSGRNYKVESEALSLAGVLYVPIGPFFEVYAKAGMAAVSVDTKVNGVSKDYDGTESFGGVGFAFDIFDTIDIYAEYLQFNNEVDSEMMGVGVRFDF